MHFKQFSEENCEKCINLADFSQNLRNDALIFCAFGRRTQIVEKFRENFEELSA